MAEDSEQPVPWVFLVAMRGAASATRAAAVDEIVDALGALPVPALDQHRAAPHRQQPLALMLDRGSLVATGSSSKAAASGRFGVMSDARGMSLVRKRVNGLGRQQPIARGCDHDGIEHDVLRRPALQPGGDGIDARKLRHHADLDRADARSENTASICAVTKSAGT